MEQNKNDFNLITGTLRGNERGFGFVVPTENGVEDIFVLHKDMGGAMHGDTVIVKRLPERGGHSDRGKVIKIVKRGYDEIVGTYYSSKRGGYVVPDDRKYFCDIFIPFGKANKAKSGDKVTAKIEYYFKRQNPEGKITEIIGRQFDKATEIKCILKNFDLPKEFDLSVLAEAKKVGKEPAEREKSKRRDLKDKLIITIDGDDAKDFDDAVSLEKTDTGYILGVHIADVSHYVKGGSLLDEEALARGNSVYFPEQVIPMLPNILSDDVCSLREGVDRLTLSCEMAINAEGEVMSSEIFESVIRSRHRMTYKKVQAILDGDEKLKSEYADIVPMLTEMEKLARLMLNRRLEKGMVDLDIRETEISVDKSGNITIDPEGKPFSTRIIEAFMIAANEAVAEYMFYLDNPFVYRVHEKPSADKMQAFIVFLKGLGINVKWKAESVRPKDFQRLLFSLKDNPIYNVINRVMLRSMQKAKYATEDIGHFGLSSEHYCHFTSPIRRYPDLIIHRIIKEFLAGNGEKLWDRYGGIVGEAAEHSSLRERVAQEAEREVDKYYVTLYMADKIGYEYDAIVSGVTSFGVFAEIKSGVEGLIKVETLKGRRYTYNEANMTLSNGRNTYKLGQTLKIVVAGIDLANKRVEFLLK